jgi:hypothetical protein
MQRWRKCFCAILGLVLVSSTVLASEFGKSLTVQEEDGSPTSVPVTKIRVPNGKLTQNAVGDVSLAFGSAETDPLSLHLDQTTGQALTNVTDVTVTASDEIYYGDVTDTNKIKKDTVQGILDLVPAPVVEGTAVKSTGEAGGTKFLREDGDGTSSWQAVPSPDLTPYAKLDGTNQPFTGNLNISKALPELRLTTTGDSSYGRIYRTTSNNMKLLNEVERPAGVYSYSGDGTRTKDITVAHSSDFTFGTGSADIPFTFSMWANGSGGNAITKWTSFAQIRAFHFVVSNTEIDLIITDKTNTSNFLKAKATFSAWSAGWHHVVCSYDASLSYTGVKIYVDGVLQTVTNAGTGVYTGAYISNTQQLTIGSWLRDQGGVGSGFNGYIDDVAIYKNRVLAATDVSDIYNSGVGRKIDPAATFPTSGVSMATSLVGLWHMDEGTGTSVADSSGLGHTGTNNAAWGQGFVFPTVAVETTILDIANGVNTNEGGIITLGDATQTPRIVIDGITTRFNVGGVEKAQLNSTGLNFIDSFPVNFGSANDASITFDGDSLNIVANAVTAADTLQLTAGGFVFNTGKVGIGMTASTELDITGQAQVISSSVYPFNSIRSTTEVTGVIGAMSAQLRTNGNMTDGFGPSYVFSIRDSEGVNRYIASIAGVRDGADTQGALVFNTNAPAFGERMRISKDGNVGIGTTAPAGNLDITKAVNGDVALLVQNTTNDTLARSRISVTSGITNVGLYALSPSYTGITNWASRAVFYGGTDTNSLTFVSGKSDGRIDFAVGGLDPVTNQKLTILSTGNVGIGTTAPVGKLDIQSGGYGLIIGADNDLTTRTNNTNKVGRIGSSHYANAEEQLAVISGSSSNASNTIFIGGGTSYYNASTLIRFYTAADQTTLTGTERFRIDSAGDVKIPADSKYLYFGAGDDATITYDGTNMLINPKAVGTGMLDVAGVLQTDGYNSADGSAGITATIVTAQLTALGSQGSMTFKDGILTAQTPAT